MSLIEKTRRSFGNRQLKKLALHTRVNAHIVPFSKAKNIIILFSTNQLQELKHVKSFINELTNQKKNVKVIGFIDKNDLAEFKTEAYTLDYITTEQLNFNLTLKDEVLSSYSSQEYDLLINLSESSLQLDLIATKLNSKFKIGRYDAEGSLVYDFMIDCKKEASISNFVAELKHYLSVLEND